MASSAVAFWPEDTGTDKNQDKIASQTQAETHGRQKKISKRLICRTWVETWSDRRHRNRRSQNTCSLWCRQMPVVTTCGLLLQSQAMSATKQGNRALFDCGTCVIMTTAATTEQNNCFEVACRCAAQSWDWNDWAIAQTHTNGALRLLFRHRIRSFSGDMLSPTPAASFAFDLQMIFSLAFLIRHITSGILYFFVKQAVRLT